MPVDIAPTVPRCLSKNQAAAYLGISPRTFDERVRAGRLPKSLEGTNQWDKVAIDLVIDKLSGLNRMPSPETEPQVTDLERFKAERAARKQGEGSAALNDRDGR